MSAIIKVSRFATKFANRNPAAAYTLVRNHWNQDYKPGPYPITREEREKAAKKYGLHADEYEPYPDDGLGSGDYPKLPDISIESKDPYYPYDFPEHKRNFNEPLHADINIIGEDRFDVSAKFRIAPYKQAMAFFSVMGVCFGIYYLLENYRFVHPLLPRQMPGEGKTHYTFEQVD